MLVLYWGSNLTMARLVLVFQSLGFREGQSADFFVREADQSNHAVQRSQIHGGKPSPDGGRLHQIDEI